MSYAIQRQLLLLLATCTAATATTTTARASCCCYLLPLLRLRVTRTSFCSAAVSMIETSTDQPTDGDELRCYYYKKRHINAMVLLLSDTAIYLLAVATAGTGTGAAVDAHFFSSFRGLQRLALRLASVSSSDDDDDVLLLLSPLSGALRASVFRRFEAGAHGKESSSLSLLIGSSSKSTHSRLFFFELYGQVVALQDIFSALNECHHRDRQHQIVCYDSEGSLAAPNGRQRSLDPPSCGPFRAKTNISCSCGTPKQHFHAEGVPPS